MSKIHVVIPVYNAKKYLQQAVDSVLDQPYKGIDIVLVDDGSTDGSSSLCDEIAEKEDRVSVIHKENGGVSSARNVGIEHFLDNSHENDYIAFLDADDMWCEAVFREISISYEDDLIGYSVYCANETATRFRADTVNEDYKRTSRLGAVEWYAIGSFAAYLYSIRLLRHYHLRFPIGVKGNEDVIFLQQVGFGSENIRYIQQPLYIYRMNPNSVTHVLRKSRCKDVETYAHIPCAWETVSSWAYMISDIGNEDAHAWSCFCKKLAGARMLESARLLVGSGASYHNFCDFLVKGQYAYLFAYICMDSLAKWQKDDFSLYLKSHVLFYIKYRIRGMVEYVVSELLKIPFLRKRREKRAFPLSSIPY